MKKTSTQAVIAVATGANPLTYVGRLVMNDGEAAGRALASACPSVFPNVEALSRFMLQYHWIGITRCDLTKEPMSSAEFAPKQTKSLSRPPVYLGDKAVILGLEGERQFITQDDNVLFADYLHVLYAPSFKLASYARENDGPYIEKAVYDLEFTDHSLPWKPSDETPDQF